MHVTYVRRLHRVPNSQKDFKEHIRGQNRPDEDPQTILRSTYSVTELLSRVGSIFCLHSVLMSQFNSHLLPLFHSPIRTPEEHIVKVVGVVDVSVGTHSTIRMVVEAE